MSAKKVAGAKAAKKVAGAGEMEKVVLTAEHFAQYPDLQAQGFTVGQEVEVPAGTYDLDEAGANETEDEGRSAEEESSMSSAPTGRFVVKMLDLGKFRLYNEVGQAVSPICETQEAIRAINTAASRSNALIDARNINTKKSSGPAPTVQ